MANNDSSRIRSILILMDILFRTSNPAEKVEIAKQYPDSDLLRSILMLVNRSGKPFFISVGPTSNETSLEGGDKRLAKFLKLAKNPHGNKDEIRELINSANYEEALFYSLVLVKDLKNGLNQAIISRIFPDLKLKNSDFLERVPYNESIKLDFPIWVELHNVEAISMKVFFMEGEAGVVSIHGRDYTETFRALLDCLTKALKKKFGRGPVEMEFEYLTGDSDGVPVLTFTDMVIEDKTTVPFEKRREALIKFIAFVAPELQGMSSLKADISVGLGIEDQESLFQALEASKANGHSFLRIRGLRDLYTDASIVYEIEEDDVQYKKLPVVSVLAEDGVIVLQDGNKEVFIEVSKTLLSSDRGIKNWGSKRVLLRCVNGTTTFVKFM